MQANHKTIDEITTSLITIQRRDPRADRSELIRGFKNFARPCSVRSEIFEFFLVLVRSVQRFNFLDLRFQIPTGLGPWIPDSTLILAHLDDRERLTDIKKKISLAIFHTAHHCGLLICQSS